MNAAVWIRARLVRLSTPRAAQVSASVEGMGEGPLVLWMCAPRPVVTRGVDLGTVEHALYSIEVAVKKVERVIVVPTSEQEAKQALRRWRARHPRLWEKLGEGDLVVDYVRSEGGKTRLQYRVFLDREDAIALDDSWFTPRSTTAC